MAVLCFVFALLSLLLRINVAIHATTGAANQSRKVHEDMLCQKEFLKRNEYVLVLFFGS